MRTRLVPAEPRAAEGPPRARCPSRSVAPPRWNAASGYVEENITGSYNLPDGALGPDNTNVTPAWSRAMSTAATTGALICMQDFVWKGESQTSEAAGYMRLQYTDSRQRSRDSSMRRT